jgi:hypothetical protein
MKMTRWAWRPGAFKALGRRLARHDLELSAAPPLRRPAQREAAARLAANMATKTARRGGLARAIADGTGAVSRLMSPPAPVTDWRRGSAAQRSRRPARRWRWAPRWWRRGGSAASQSLPPSSAGARRTTKAAADTQARPASAAPASPRVSVAQRRCVLLAEAARPATLHRSPFRSQDGRHQL